MARTLKYVVNETHTVGPGIRVETLKNVKNVKFTLYNWEYDQKH
jgi:hypothetical protein